MDLSFIHSLSLPVVGLTDPIIWSLSISSFVCVWVLNSQGRVPRTIDFVYSTREKWDGSLLPVIQQGQHRLLSLMNTNLAPLLPIKMDLSQLTQHSVIDVCPLLMAAFLDGRNGMSYGFLAFQLPSGGPVEACKEIKVLVTRSGCDKQRPHPNDDWVILSCDMDNIGLETSAKMKRTTSPSFDSWLILAQVSLVSHTTVSQSVTSLTEQASQSHKSHLTNSRLPPCISSSQPINQ